MCAYILLNILNESGKRDKCEACRAFNFFFATRLINSIVQENEYKNKLLLKEEGHPNSLA